jgi:hypothetical protein
LAGGIEDFFGDPAGVGFKRRESGNEKATGDPEDKAGNHAPKDAPSEAIAIGGGFHAETLRSGYAVEKVKGEPSPPRYCGEGWWSRGESNP